MKKAAIYGQSYAISSEKEIKTLLHVLNKNNIEFYIENDFKVYCYGESMQALLGLQ